MLCIEVEMFIQNFRKKGMVKFVPSIEEVILSEPNIVIDRGRTQSIDADGHIKSHIKFVLHLAIIILNYLNKIP